MKKYLVSIVLVVALLVTAMAFTAQAEVDKNAISAGIANGTYLANLTDGCTAVCPYCGEPQTWKALGATDGMTAENTHYFLSEKHTGSLSPKAETGTCLYLNGKDITVAGVAFAVEGYDLTVMGKGTETVSGCNYGNYPAIGATVDLIDGTLNLCGGIYMKGDTANAGCVIGLRNTAGILNIYEGTQIVDGNNETHYGGNVAVYAKESEVNMYGGSITGGSAKQGGNVYIEAKCTFNMYGGEINGGTATTSNGGNIALVYTGVGEIGLVQFNMYGGRVSGGEAGNWGGNIYIEWNTVNIYGGTLTGGKATTGGNIGVNYSYLNVTGGVISNGEATDGGNIYYNTNTHGATIADDGDHATALPVISGGVATNNGGNIYLGTALTLGSGIEISGGDAGYGGNLYVTGCKLTLDGATVSDGVAKIGGNIYNSTAGQVQLDNGAVITGGKAIRKVGNSGLGGNIYMSSTNTKVYINDGAITCGHADGNGGNLFLNNGEFYFYGGEVSDGTATHGGNLYLNQDTYCYTVINDKPADGVEKPQIKDGFADGGYGGNLYLANVAGVTAQYDAVCKLGSCEITGGYSNQKGNDIYLDPITSITVLAAFDGDAGIRFNDKNLPAAVYGGTLDATYTCEEPFSGKLWLEGDYGEPYIYGEGTQLKIAGAALFSTDETKTWYKDNAAAVDAYNNTTAWLQANAGELVLKGGSYVVDLAGQSVDITGSGEVTCFDSSNDTYETCGSATVTGADLKNDFVETINGKNYVKVEEEGSYSFHRMGLAMTGVSLRPSTGGIYYTAKWECDEVVAALVKNFGVAVSVADMPDANLRDDDDTLWTTFDKEAFESGVKKTGVMIERIVKDTNQNDKNASNAMTEIFAKAYVVLDNGTQDGQIVISNDDVQNSLHDVVSLIDERIHDYSAHVQTMKNFCQKWAQYGLTGEDWTFEFDVPQEIIQLNNLYAGLTPYHGEFHDHTNTDTGDGKNSLAEWKEAMEEIGMDFATIVDHRQVTHMYHEDWDETVFIGGTEPAALLSGVSNSATTRVIHYNMVFSDPEGLKNVLRQFSKEGSGYDDQGNEKNDSYYFDEETGHFQYYYMHIDTLREIAQSVKDNGGLFVHVHPKSEMQSTNPLDYYVIDWTGLEVFYTYGSNRSSNIIKENYKLWTDLLAMGKKLWATAGYDGHKLPSVTALSTVYATEKHADALMDQMRIGNFTCGPVGIRMAIGDTVTGSECSFTGKKLAFAIGDFHESAYDETHTYRADLITDKGVVQSWTLTNGEDFYQVVDVDNTAAFYRIELVDVTADSLLAIGNPIWNTEVTLGQ